MGLDAAELVMEVEDRFGVRLPEFELYWMRTLGDLHNALLEQCGVRKRTECPTRKAFYRLRRELGQVLGIPTAKVRPSTPVPPLLGRWRRCRTWRRVQAELGWRLPPLESRAGTGVFAGMAVGSVAVFLAAALLADDLFLAAGLALFALLPGALLGYIVGVFWARSLLSPLHTAGGVARAIVVLNPKEFYPDEESPHAGDPIWNQLCDIVAAQFRVPRETLHRDTRFVEDLGC